VRKIAGNDGAAQKIQYRSFVISGADVCVGQHKLAAFREIAIMKNRSLALLEGEGEKYFAAGAA